MADTDLSKLSVSQAAHLTMLLSRFEETASQLREATNSLNSILNDVEKQLNEANVGVEVWLPTPFVERDEGSKREWLGYAKVDRKWRIAVKHVTLYGTDLDLDDDDPNARNDDSPEQIGENASAFGDPAPENEAIPLAQASRELRIAALDHLPALIGAVDAEAKKELQKVQGVLKKSRGAK